MTPTKLSVEEKLKKKKEILCVFFENCLRWCSDMISSYKNEKEKNKSEYIF